MPATTRTAHSARPIRITALLTSHNRRQLTVASLGSLFAAAPDGVVVDAVLCDDASTDGTSDAVAAAFPDVAIVSGDGNYFWARGMAAAEAEALRGRDVDFLLWLNDDVSLRASALSTLLAVVQERGPAVVCGAVCDPDTGQLTYSGVRRLSAFPLRFGRVPPSGIPARVDTCNGNVVLVPVDVARRLGGIDGKFRHGYADFDYGLRAADAGIPVLLAPGMLATCRANPGPPAWRDPRRTAAERWRQLLGPKGLPPRSHALFLRRHGGRAWPIAWAVPYVRAALDAVLEQTDRRRRPLA